MHLSFDLARRAAESRVIQALDQIDRDASEQREAERRPFFGPVTVTLPGAPLLRFSAFARDVSPLGVGLVHIMPIERGEVLIEMASASSEVVVFRTQIIWCRDYGDGWYASGGRLLDVFDVGKN